MTDEELQAAKESWGIYLYRPTAPDPLLHKHTNDQLGFHKSQAFLRVITGPNRAGKTTPMCAEFGALGLGGNYPDWFNWAPQTIPTGDVTMWLCMPTFPVSFSADARLKKLFFGYNVTDGRTGERRWMPPFIRSEWLLNPGCLHQADIRFIEWTMPFNGKRAILVLKSALQPDMSAESDEPDIIGIDEPTEPNKFWGYVARGKSNPAMRMIHCLTDIMEGGETDYLDPLYDNEMAKVFHFSEGGNPHEFKEHADRVMSLLPEEQRRVRGGGETITQVRLCYPHVFKHLDPDTKEEVLNPWGGHGNWIPREKIFNIPSSWTRYCVHDPGTTNPAATGWYAIEPGLENVYCYRVLYQPDPSCDVEEIVRAIFEATGSEVIRSFFIDPKAGKFPQKFVGWAPKEKRLVDLYNLSARRLLGREFYWAMAADHLERASKMVRIAALTGYLSPFNKTVPMMWFFDDGSYGMEMAKFEFRKYHKAAAKKGRTNNPEDAVDKHNHFIYTAEVVAKLGLRWFPPDGQGWSVIPRPRDPLDPGGKLRKFMEGGFPEDHGKSSFI